jgi:integrase
MGRSSVPAPRRSPKSGLWEFTFESTHRRADGQRKQIHRSNFKTRSEAKAEMDRLMHADRNLVAIAADDLTVGDLLDQYLTSKRLAGRSPASINQDEWAVRRLKGLWGGWNAASLRSDQVEAGFADLLATGRLVFRRGSGNETTEKPLSARSVRHFNVVLKAAYNLAVARGLVMRNPAALVRVGSSRSLTEPRPYWTPEQVESFLAFVASQSELPIGLVETLVYSGLRRGEVLALRWADFDEDNGTLTISRQLRVDSRSNEVEAAPTKRKRSRSVIHLPEAAVGRLKQRRAQQNRERLVIGAAWPTAGPSADLVFTKPDGAPIHPSVLTRVVGRLSERAGLPRITPHGLRHSFATAALTSGHAVEVVADRLGNTPRVIQETYAHVLPADDEALANAVASLYQGQQPAKP